MTDSMIAMDIARTGVSLGDRIRVADTFLTRLIGLLRTPHLDAGQGLLIRPCRSVHMFGMRYAIDAVFLDVNHTVCHLLPGLGPWRVSPVVWQAIAVLELPAGAIARNGLQVGDILVVRASQPMG